MAQKITSPIEGYNGRSTFGPFNVEFKGGSAVLPEVNDGLRLYLEGAGYTLEEEAGEEEATEKAPRRAAKGAETPGKAAEPSEGAKA